MQNLGTRPRLQVADHFSGPIHRLARSSCLLIEDDTVEDDTEWVGKHCTGFVERDGVFPHIRGGLVPVPFEPHSHAWLCSKWASCQRLALHPAERQRSFAWPARPATSQPRYALAAGRVKCTGWLGPGPSAYHFSK